MTDKDHKARRSVNKKVMLQKGSASEIISSLKITPGEIRRAKVAVEFVMRSAGEVDRPSIKTPSKSKSRAAEK